MSYYDAKGILVEALKEYPDLFQLSNLILPKAGSIKAVYKLAEIKSVMYEFAKDPETGTNMLPRPPRKPEITGMNQDDAQDAEAEYLEMMKAYDQQVQALSMHVPVSDMVNIDNFVAKFERTLHATSAIKGNRFFAFTKNTEEPESGPLDFLKGLGGKQGQQ